MGEIAMRWPKRYTGAAFLISWAGLLFLGLNTPSTIWASAAKTYQVGIARSDITPRYPIRLHGFGFRRQESDGVRHPIWAKALAISHSEEPPVVLIAVDNLGVPAELVQKLARRLQQKTKLPPERLAITATHTHTGPMLQGVAPTIFGMDIPSEHQKHIDRYTTEFTDKLEQIALEALQNRQPARLYHGIGKTDLASNRRIKGGPVDHDLPVLVARSKAGKILAVHVNYACHCVTLSDNKISGDWAGYAQEQLERMYPGAVVLLSIGCGADANPRSGVMGDRGDIATAQGLEIATAVDRVLKSDKLREIQGPITSRVKNLTLDLDTLPTRADWEKKAEMKNATGYHARVQLARLDRGDKLTSSIPYPIQSWTFDNTLAMIFLPGEVVVDYALRLKKELDGSRLWINAYANAAPCYIPSERVLREGGYEGGGAMIYYDLPTRLKPGLEQQIIGAVHQLLGTAFSPSKDAHRAPEPPPLSPEESLARLRTHDNLKVELVAAEPLTTDPVAIDFGPDGRLWVCEMHDYPTGLDGQYQPGGRIRVLESSQSDGKYDRSTIFRKGYTLQKNI
jgi:hypothetical protein